MTEKTELSWKDGHGRTVTQQYEHEIPDIRRFLGLAGYPWLVLAANPHLSVGKIAELLAEQSVDTPGINRSESWLQRRRWMFKPGGNYVMDRDGNLARALRIMDANPECSAGQLVRLLKDHSINRSREWVRKHRVTR